MSELLEIGRGHGRTPGLYGPGSERSLGRLNQGPFRGGTDPLQSAAGAGSLYEVGVSDPYGVEIFATSGLVGYWRLNDGDLIARDVLGNAHGVYTGGVQTQQPSLVVGGDSAALHESGQITKIPDGASLDVADTLSIEFWVRRDNVGVTQRVISKGTDAFTVAFNASNFIEFSKQNTAIIVTSNVAITDVTDPHHVVITKSGAVTKIWIDGVDATGTITNQTLLSNAIELWFGNIPPAGAANYMDGVLDEVALYDVALDFATIESHFYRGRGVSDPYGQEIFTTSGLVAYYRQSDLDSVMRDAFSNLHGIYAGAVGQGAASLVVDGDSAAVYDGSTTWGDVSNDARLELAGNLSLEAWFSPSILTGGDDHIIRKGSEYMLYRTGTELTFAIKVGGTIRALATVGLGLAVDTTYHAVGTYDGANQRIYVDGVEVAIRAQTGAVNTTTTGLSVARQPGLVEVWTGTLDEVALYDVALDAATILEHFQLGSGAAPIFFEVGQVLETDTAQPLILDKSLIHAQVSEVDSSQAITSAKIFIYGQVVESDIAQITNYAKTSEYAQISEVDTANQLTSIKTQTYAQVVEADVSGLYASEKVCQYGQVIETDSVFPFVRTIALIYGQVLESDTVQEYVSAKQSVFGQVIETAVAQEYASIKVSSYGVVTEDDIVQAYSSDKQRAYGQVVDGQVAQSYTSAKQQTFGQATETDIAQAYTSSKISAYSQTVEADVAFSPDPFKSYQLGQTSEADTSSTYISSKDRGYDQASEADQSHTLASAKQFTYGQAVENDIAQPLPGLGDIEHEYGQVVEVDVVYDLISVKQYVYGEVVDASISQSLIGSKEFTIGQAIEQATAQTPIFFKEYMYERAEEVDTAQPYVIFTGDSSEKQFGRVITGEIELIRGEVSRKRSGSVDDKSLSGTPALASTGFVEKGVRGD